MPAAGAVTSCTMTRDEDRLDSNVLAYAEGVNGAAMRDKVLALIQRLPQGAVVLPVQTLGELFNVLVRTSCTSAPQANKRWMVQSMLAFGSM